MLSVQFQPGQLKIRKIYIIYLTELNYVLNSAEKKKEEGRKERRKEKSA